MFFFNSLDVDMLLYRGGWFGPLLKRFQKEKTESVSFRRFVSSLLLLSIFPFSSLFHLLWFDVCVCVCLSMFVLACDWIFLLTRSNCVRNMVSEIVCNLIFFFFFFLFFFVFFFPFLSLSLPLWC